MTASGSGAVTISWEGTAEGFNGTYGDVLHLCAADAGTCGPGAPGSVLFTYVPAEGATSATLSPGVAVTDSGGAPTSLPTGSYALQAVSYQAADPPDDTTPVPIPIGDLLNIQIGGARDLTVWHQSTARASVDASCPSGWTPSWAQWPNDGAGGHVCNRQIYAYYPDEPVPEPGWVAPDTAWQVAVGRADAQAPCPQGWTPSWAQWPNDGAGGFVCSSAR